jgi:hypothetical protein
VPGGARRTRPQASPRPRRRPAVSGHVGEVGAAQASTGGEEGEGFQQVRLARAVLAHQRDDARPVARSRVR